MISPRNTLNNAFEICQPVAGKSSPTAAQEASRIVLSEKCQTPSGELAGRLLVDFGKHFHLNWPHYRLLLVHKSLKSGLSCMAGCWRKGKPKIA